MTSDFQKYINLSGFKIQLCRAYDPESKGKIEAVVKFTKNTHRNIYPRNNTCCLYLLSLIHIKKILIIV